MMIRSKLTAFLLFCVLFVIPIHSRYVQMPVTSLPACRKFPCGWSIYNQETRQYGELQRFLCTCPKSYTCAFDFEEEEISAAIYTCQYIEPGVPDKPIL